MIDHIEVAFNLWYPTSEFWIYYFFVSACLLPLGTFRANQMRRNHRNGWFKEEGYRLVIFCFIMPAFSVGAIYGIYKHKDKYK